VTASGAGTSKTRAMSAVQVTVVVLRSDVAA
jgi:hypothetical protein